MSLDYSFIFDENKAKEKQDTPKDFGVWGLNQNATVVEFKTYPQGVNGSSACVRYVVSISGNQYSGIVYAESRIYQGGKELRPGDKGYEEALKKETQGKMKTLVHVAKAVGLTREILENSLNTRMPSTFIEFATLVTNLCQSYIGKAKVDVFLEYQPKLKNGKQYKQIPESSFSGAFMVPTTQGAWSRAMQNGMLTYIWENNPEEKHPFWRTTKYMQGPRARRHERDAAQGMPSPMQQELKTDISQFGEDLPW